MNRSPDRDRLLADVMSEAAPSDFREALLDETLQLARRRRLGRRLRMTAAGLAALCATGLLSWRAFQPRQDDPVWAASMCRTVRTQPLPGNEIVSSRPLGVNRLVSSTPTVVVVSTAISSGQVRFLTDDELLALLAPRTPALVRVGPHSQELIFADPDDTGGAPVN
jgi:hypothetical protein